ncbi:MAG: Maf family protein [Pseudomonadota bacterium]
MTLAPPPIVLASGSGIRRSILEAAGISFTIERPDIDETSLIEDGVGKGRPLTEIAGDLAGAKAKAVNVADEAFVIGSDQILGFQEAAFEKPKDLAEARERLLLLQGQTHVLINAVSVVRAGEQIFDIVDEARLTMRSMTLVDIDAYLEAAGEAVLSSVGAYQLEGLGARLFEKVEGDFFTVLGLSLFPLLKFLRDESVIPY